MTFDREQCRNIAEQAAKGAGQSDLEALGVDFNSFEIGVLFGAAREREACAVVAEDHAVIDQHLHVYDHTTVTARLIRKRR